MNYTKIAKTIISHSLGLTKGNILHISIRGKSQIPLANEVKHVAESMGIATTTSFHSTNYLVNFFETCTETELNAFIDSQSKLMRDCHGIAIIRENISMQFSPSARVKYNKYHFEVHEKIRLKKKWLLTGLPCQEECGGNDKLYNEMMQTYISSCSIDYLKMSNAMANLVKRLTKADRVRIITKNTDISFSIKDMPVIKCVGECNLPDGEVFTAPIKDSVNGYITYNLPSKQNGIIHNNVKLEFQNGKIIKCESDHPTELQQIFDTDEGARYIGEFAFGLNPFVTKAFTNTLYDEKNSGTIHFTPGASYDDCFNGNKSAVHWDLVQSHLPEFGGGEIWLDDTLVRKDGLFVTDDLLCLNPTNLI